MRPLSTIRSSTARQWGGISPPTGALIEPNPSRIVHVEHIHPQSEIAILRCDAGRARQVLGWSPEISLAEGLALTRAWMADRLTAGMPVA